MIRVPDGARCADPDVDPEWFFPEPIPDDLAGLTRVAFELIQTEKAELAMRTCSICPVRAACADAAMSYGPSLKGIWGGKDELERRTDRKVMAKAKIVAMIAAKQGGVR